MDIEALNNQVEERKIREAEERYKEHVYGKSPRPKARLWGLRGVAEQEPEGIKVGQFCLLGLGGGLPSGPGESEAIVSRFCLPCVAFSLPLPSYSQVSATCRMTWHPRC